MKNPRTAKKQTFALDTFDQVSTKLSQNMHRDLGQLILSNNIDPTARKKYMSAQQGAYLKKYVPYADDGGEDEKQKKTFSKFLDVNQHMANYLEGDLDLPLDRNLLCSLSHRSDILLRARLIARSILTPFTSEEWFSECKNSGGTSLGVPFYDTSVEMKFKFPITCTERAQPLLAQYFTYDFQLSDAIQDLNSQNPVRDRYCIVEGSRATTVPKSSTIRRMIAIEPTGNMFLQQGLMSMMYKRMTAYGLNVKSLPKLHGDLALQGSITGLLATIDFSSASDCVSRDFLRWLIPPFWFRCLNDVTSERIKIDQDYVETNMFSTMGNAGTFPLETILFYSLAMACHLRSTNAPSSYPEQKDRLAVSVFGDDCILNTKAAPLFMEVAESVGFIVNKEKSFFRDKPGFRESCGNDFLRGRNVRPLYFKEPHTHRRSDFEPWLYTCMNKIITKYNSYFGGLTYLYEKRALKYFEDLCVAFDIEVKLIPNDYPDDSGLKISDDLPRFVKCYPRIKLSQIHRSMHGNTSFLYHKFVFSDNKNRNDHVRYCIWLKKPVITNWWDPCRDPIDQFPVRRKGGYVVARGMASNWSFPPLKL